ncbi:EAL domain-containing protein, partial [Brucella abortus]|nr:EAL domain-containing protein [Brucella abortus]
MPSAKSVAYQPIVSAQSLRIVACEALARWNHAEAAASSAAAEFIPVCRGNRPLTQKNHLLHTLEQACIVAC